MTKEEKIHRIEGSAGYGMLSADTIEKVYAYLESINSDYNRIDIANAFKHFDLFKIFK